MRVAELEDMVPGAIIMINRHGKEYYLATRVTEEKIYFHTLNRVDDNQYKQKSRMDNAYLRVSSVGSNYVKYIGFATRITGDKIYIKPPTTTRKIGKYKITRRL